MGRLGRHVREFFAFPAKGKVEYDCTNLRGAIGLCCERLSMALTPEEQARKTIDEALHQAGWDVQDVSHVNVNAAPGVAIREFPLKAGYGTADYLLYVNEKAAGALEAKKEGTTLSGVEIQTEKYSEGVPPALPTHVRPLPFLYQSTGVETFFSNLLDPEPRSRRHFHFHRPEALADWFQADPQAPG